MRQRTNDVTMSWPRRAAVLGLAATLAVVGVALGGAAGARAQPAPARDQMDPALTYQPDRDEFLLVWSEDRGGGPRVMAKRVRGNGLPVGGAMGGEWEIAGTVDPTGQKGEQRWPSVEEDLLVWSEKLPGGTDFDLYAQRLFSNGRAQGHPVLIAGGPGDQRYGDIIRASGGEWLVVWSEDVNDAGDVMGRRLSNALTPRSNAFPVAQGPGVAEDPAIAYDPGDSNFLIVFFTDDRNGNKDIYATRLADTGLPRSGPKGGQFPVVQSPENDYAPAVAVANFRGTGADSSRNILLWTTDSLTNGPDVMAQRIRSNGLPQGKPFAVAGGAGTQSAPAVALHDADEWLAVWNGDAGGSLDVIGVDVRTNGIPRPQERVLASD
jgi:hypothetical protein